MVIVILFLVLIVFSIIDFMLTEKSDKEVKATCDWCDAGKELREYIGNESTERNLNYKIPTHPSQFTSNKSDDDIFDTVTYKKLLRKERIAFISFLETHKFCIQSQKSHLIELLDEIDDDEQLVQRVLRLICL